MFFEKFDRSLSRILWTNRSNMVAINTSTLVIALSMDADHINWTIFNVHIICCDDFVLNPGNSFSHHSYHSLVLPMWHLNRGYTHVGLCSCSSASTFWWPNQKYYKTLLNFQKYSKTLLNFQKHTMMILLLEDKYLILSETCPECSKNQTLLNLERPCMISWSTWSQPIIKANDFNCRTFHQHNWRINLPTMWQTGKKKKRKKIDINKQ